VPVHVYATIVVVLVRENSITFIIVVVPFREKKYEYLPGTYLYLD